nr:alpha/beta hydrolase [uncultured Desulfobacter sp.]
MSKVLIGIHGLSNKPEEETLKKWWEEAIKEGLKKNTGIQNPKFDFQSVYWADVMYDKPDPTPDAYTAAKPGAIKTYEESWLDAVREETFSWGGEILDVGKKYFGMDRIADEVLQRKLKDLHRYYTNPEDRNKLRDRLRNAIIDNQSKRIMILSHSMGTIIAYDVLREMGETHPRLEIDHLVTIGSPLGLPHVKYKIQEERNYVRTPSIVKKWSNFADKRDPVSFDVYLSGDYAPNSDGIQVKDDLVANDWGGIHHKSYGYLRTPEVSKAIRSFI